LTPGLKKAAAGVEEAAVDVAAAKVVAAGIREEAETEVVVKGTPAVDDRKDRADKAKVKVAVTKDRATKAVVDKSSADQLRPDLAEMPAEILAEMLEATPAGKSAATRVGKCVAM
jgi:hypothetical protein